ncbi:3-deoxy-D-manno-octulosonic acid transferase [Anaeroselena agilis]|uniref:3-deoxy-D-manno-octulosonic acid transferase n=1 Tax=Anaeroselena agilis TaxID=3063788 RepID=A0ABU3P430_9FIRM|nr:3-deoxy-D-manno-octulosonic acid transferase [Selenomonadales bacterium 4137-cl]
MKFLYDILTIILVVAAIPVFIFRLFREKGFGERLRQSFGFLPHGAVAPVAGKNCLWLHAASVGEIVATSPIVKEIRRQMPEMPVLVSVVTANGYEMAQRIIPEADSIIFFPLDLPGLSRRVINRIKPTMFVLVETELWPNFLLSCRDLSIPVMMVNGRISDKSVGNYRYLFTILDRMLDTVHRFCMQSTIDAQYIIRLGAKPRRVFVTGNTKYDQTHTEVSAAERERLASLLKLRGGAPVVVAGSTHRGEEEFVLAAFNKVRENIAEARLIIAPRDNLRGGEVASLAEKYGLKAVRRTDLDKADGSHDVIVLDTIGELGKIYSIADVVFVGGSLVATGGHNILEPAAHGKPILVGPHMFNFKDSYALFSGQGACDTVYDSADLGDKFVCLLSDAHVRAAMGEKALAIIRENQGAAVRSVQHISEVLATLSQRS